MNEVCEKWGGGVHRSAKIELGLIQYLPIKYLISICPLNIWKYLPYTMPSSSRPYQSKLLRFALQQWQQGLERQNRAWRQLQSTAAWGAQVAVFPIYAIMRAVKRASFVLSSSNATPEESPASEITNAARENVTDIDHTLTAILTHTQQLLASEEKSQPPIVAKNPLAKKAHSLLSNTIAQIQQLLPGNAQRRANPAVSINPTQHRSGELIHNRSARPSSGQLAARATGIRHKVAANLLQNGTTLASSIETRNLILVAPHNKAFDILTPEHQADLKHYIDRVMDAYRQSRTLSRRPTKRLSARIALEIGASSDAFLTVVLAHTQQLLSPKQKAQLNIAPTGSFIRQIRTLFAGSIRRIRQQLPGSLPSARRNKSSSQAQRRSGDLANPNRTQKSGGLQPAVAAIDHRAASDLLPNGTTLASSIATQKLVLVNASNEVFDIFTPEQQTDLGHYITAVMLAYRQSRSMVPRQTKRLSVKTVLAIGAVFIAALPVEFKKAWVQITPGPTPSSRAPSLPHITNNSSTAQPSSRIFYPTSSARGTVRTHVQRLSGHGNNHPRRRLTSRSPNAFEVNVNDVSYLEHPLERLLRWVDRILTWCEHRWQKMFPL